MKRNWVNGEEDTEPGWMLILVKMGMLKSSYGYI